MVLYFTPKKRESYSPKGIRLTKQYINNLTKKYPNHSLSLDSQMTLPSEVLLKNACNSKDTHNYLKT